MKKYDIKWVKVSDLKEYEKNNKKHPEKQISLLVENIDRFGFTSPVLVDKDNVLIAGHARTKAAKRLGMSEVPAVLVDDLSEDEIKALRIADNKLAELAENDMTNLAEEFAALDFDLQSMTGWTTEDFKGMGLKDEEEPEVPFAEELGEKHNYVVLYFDNEVDWLQIETILGDLMPKCKAKNSKEGYEQIGIGRVVKGSEAMKKFSEVFGM